MTKRKISVFDFETDPFDGTTNILPFVSGYYDGKDFKYWWGEDCNYELAVFLNDRYEICYAHNGGKFDFYYLLPWLERDLITVINGRISQAALGKSLLRDSFLLYPLALAKYKKDEINYEKMKRNLREEHKDEIISYLRTDCISLYEIVTNFIERFGRQLTIATASMKEFRKTLLPEDIERFTPERDSLFRKYYYGGRCEALVKGKLKGEYVGYDINSAYSRSMIEQHPDPCSTEMIIQNTIPNTHVYFAEIKAISYGCLPYRNDEKKLIFPRDNEVRTYYATGYEIAAGLRTNTLDIKNINVVYVPEKTRSFNEYVSRFWEEKFLRKKENDILGEQFAKLMLNSPYGKLALNPRDYKKWYIADIGCDPPEYEDQLYPWELVSAWPTFGIDIYNTPDPSLDGFYNVSTAASITGWVRAFLWETACQCDSVVYFDTDYILCKKFNGIIGNGLGEWKHEGNVNQGYIAGKKLYAFYSGIKKGDTAFSDIDPKTGKYLNWKYASKGVRLTPKDIAEIATSDNVIVWFSEAPVFSLKYGQRTLQREVKQT